MQGPRLAGDKTLNKSLEKAWQYSSVKGDKVYVEIKEDGCILSVLFNNLQQYFITIYDS